MKSMHDLKDMLCEELEMIAKKGNVSHTDLENVYKLTESIKNIMKIDEMDESGASSRSYGRYRMSYGNDGRSYNDSSYDGDWRAMGSYADSRDGNFDRDTSGRSRHYVRGHYSYDGGILEEKLGEMMNDSHLSLDDKSTLKRAMDIIKR